MSRSRHDFPPTGPARPDGAPQPGSVAQPRSGLMRRYETAARLPDGSLSVRQIVAPATPPFEEATTAFARGTLLPTPDGPRAVEDLAPGDHLDTGAGVRRITWIGSTTYVPGHRDGTTLLTTLTRLTADACAPGDLPLDVLTGPAARLVIRHERLDRLLGHEAVLAPVSDYADGERFLRVTPAGPVQLYHVAVKGHTTLAVGGVEMETYHPGKALQALESPSLRMLFLSMFRHVRAVEEFGEVTLSRTTRDVIETLLDS